MRRDGIRVKQIDPMYAIVPYIMPKRYDAMNMITLDIPMEPMQKYIQQQRREERFYSHMSIILAAYVRIIHEFPRVNRFIVNRRIYQRNEISVATVVLKPGDDDNSTMSKIYFESTDTIAAVNERITQYLDKNRVEEGANSTDALMHALVRIPGLLGIGVGVLKTMDKFGLMPKKIIDASPFHTSLALTNLASIRTNHIYHHIYDFGTTSIFIALGSPREVTVRVKGELESMRCLPMGVVMDERVCSGSYFARVFSRMRHYLNNPSLLEQPPADDSPSV